MATTVETIDDLLSQTCCDLGKPEQRQERAARLVNEGLTVADLEELIEWSHRSRKKLHTVGNWIGWVTRTRVRWSSTIESIRKFKAARDRIEPPSISTRPREVEEIDLRMREQGMAWARVRADRAAPEVVAFELGITIERLNELVDAEDALRRPKQEAKTQEEVW